MPSHNDPFEELLEKEDPFDSILAEDFDSPVTATPQGGVTAPVGPATPIPKADETNLVCLRGPCKYYFEVKKRVPHGNPVGTFTPETEPRQTTRICLKANADLTDEAIYDCNAWLPISHLKRASRQTTRNNWAKKANQPWYDREKKEEQTDG